MARRLIHTWLRQSLSSPSPISSAPRFALFSCASNSRLVGEQTAAFFVDKLPWMLSTVQHYAKRRTKLAHDPYAWIKVGENEPCPVSQPNKGSVKNRNQKKRMAQRDAFIKEQAQARIKSCREAKERKLEARRKHWKECAARARAWKEKKAAEAKQAEAQQSVSV